VLANVGKPTAEEITLTDIASRVDVLKQMRLNGDGVVPATSTDDPETRQTIDDIIARMGG